MWQNRHRQTERQAKCVMRVCVWEHFCVHDVILTLDKKRINKPMNRFERKRKTVLNKSIMSHTRPNCAHFLLIFKLFSLDSKANLHASHDRKMKEKHNKSILVAPIRFYLSWWWSDGISEIHSQQNSGWVMLSNFNCFCSNWRSFHDDDDDDDDNKMIKENKMKHQRVCLRLGIVNGWVSESLSVKCHFAISWKFRCVWKRERDSKKEKTFTLPHTHTQSHKDKTHFSVKWIRVCNLIALSPSPPNSLIHRCHCARSFRKWQSFLYGKYNIYI